MAYGEVYAFRLKGTNCFYVGQTASFKIRKGQHRAAYKKGNGAPKFYKALRKHGWENFESFILASANTKRKLLDLEKYFIELFSSEENGFNSKIKRFDHSQLERIAGLINGGMSQVRAARELGITYATVSYYLKVGRERNPLLIKKENN